MSLVELADRIEAERLPWDDDRERERLYDAVHACVRAQRWHKVWTWVASEGREDLHGAMDRALQRLDQANRERSVPEHVQAVEELMRVQSRAAGAYEQRSVLECSEVSLQETVQTSNAE